MKRTIIDVSEHQGIIDWEKVKGHIDGAILRCGYGSDFEKQDDACFKRNADECTRLGIPFGVYLYSYADTADKAKSEAAHVLRLVKGYKLAYPVYLDLEENKIRKNAKECAAVFGDVIEKAGYWCGIYANLHWWETYLPGLERFTKWVAQYYTKCEYTGANLDMWQHTSQGTVEGIRGNVDMNECYRDFPAEILEGKAQEKPAETPTDSPAANVYRVKSGDTLSGIAAKFGVKLSAIARVNEIEDVNKIYTGQILTIPEKEETTISGAQYHTVQAGETLTYIAAKYGTTYTALAKLNGIKNPNLIYTGQKLRIK